jgi:hypothetical protein
MFTIVKGSSGFVGCACAPENPNIVNWANAPQVTDSPNGFANSSCTFTKDINSVQMLDGCPKAAFGENLSVAATAINGWARLTGLNGYATPKAFALNPQNNEE